MSRRRLPYSQSGKRPFTPRISFTSWLFMGLLVGLGAGLYYAWIVQPIVYLQASPARLNEAAKAEYIVLVSQSYAANGNWAQAEQRLAALEDPQMATTVNQLLEQSVRQLKPVDLLRNLAALAQQLGAEGGAVPIFAPTPDVLPTPTLVAQLQTTAVASPSPTPTAVPSHTPTPTATQVNQPTAVFTFQLVAQEQICDSDTPGHIQVVVENPFSQPLPGVEIHVRWANGQDRFFTGFKPENGLGYADFSMSPDLSYTAVLADGSPEVSGLRIEPCANGREGSWQLQFQQLTASRQD